MSAGSQPVPLLRPLGVADILDHSVRLYRQNFGPFLAITAVVYVPVTVLQMLGAFFMGRMMVSESAEPDWTALVPFGLFMGGAMLAYVLAIPICQGALSIAVARRYLGQPATLADAYRSIGDRWGTLIAAVLLQGLIVAVGTMLCIIPGIYLMVVFLFVAPVVAIESQSVMGSFQRSQDLVRGDWWRCFSVYFVLSLIVGVVVQAVAIPLSLAISMGLMESSPALGQALNQGVSMAVTLFIQPVQVIGLVLLYYDVRVRREGFDLQLLAENLGTTAPVAPLERSLLPEQRLLPVHEYTSPPPPALVTPLPPKLGEPASPPAPAEPPDDSPFMP